MAITMKPVAFCDLADLPEDKRIDCILDTMRQRRAPVRFVTDEAPGKLDRYIRKLKAKEPGIIVTSRGIGPANGCVHATIAPPLCGAVLCGLTCKAYRGHEGDHLYVR